MARDETLECLKSKREDSNLKSKVVPNEFIGRSLEEPSDINDDFSTASEGDIATKPLRFSLETTNSTEASVNSKKEISDCDKEADSSERADIDKEINSSERADIDKEINSSERADIDKETNSINLSTYKIYDALPSTSVSTTEQSTISITKFFLQVIPKKQVSLYSNSDFINLIMNTNRSTYIKFFASLQGPQTSSYNVSAGQPDHFPHSSTKRKVHFLDLPENLCTIEPQISVSLLDSSTSGILQGIDHNEDLKLISGQSTQQEPCSMHTTLNPLEQSQQNFGKASKEQLATSLEIANGEMLIEASSCCILPDFCNRVPYLDDRLPSDHSEQPEPCTTMEIKENYEITLSGHMKLLMDMHITTPFFVHTQLRVCDASTVCICDHNFSNEVPPLEETSTTNINGDDATVPKCCQNHCLSSSNALLQITKQYKAMNYEEMQYMLFDSICLAQGPLDVICYLFGIGLAYYKQQKYSEAIEHLRKSEEKSRDCCPDHTSLSDISLCRVYMGDAEMSLGNFQSAVDHFHEAVMTHQPNVISVLQQCYRLSQVTLSAKMNKFALSLHCDNLVVDSEMFYRQSLLCADATPADIISARIGLGNLLHSVGDNERAVEEFLIAITKASKEAEGEIERPRVNQDFEINQDLVDQAVQRKMDANLSLAWVHGNLGSTYLSLGKKEQGLHHLQLSLELTLQHEPTPSAISRALNNLGTAYQALSLFDEAESYYDEALSQAIFGNDLIGQAIVYVNIGNLYMIKNNYWKASSHYTEPLRLIAAMSSVSIFLNYLRGISHSLVAFSQSAVSLERRYILMEVVGKLAQLRYCYGVKVEDVFPYDSIPFFLINNEVANTSISHPCIYSEGIADFFQCDSIIIPFTCIM